MDILEFVLFSSMVSDIILVVNNYRDINFLIKKMRNSMNIGIRADGLSPSDFEDFSIEIVKRKFGNQKLHGFKEGKDYGIDAIDDIESPTLIMQAKRWEIKKSQTTACDQLKAEIDKISKAKAHFNWGSQFKYVIVTSMGLSPQKLKEVREHADQVIPDAIPSDEHIIFASTLNTFSQDARYKGVFQDYGLVEKDYSVILKNVKIKGIEFESKDYFSSFNFKYFVETSFIGKAYQILQEQHILLIYGPAGMGKTTTCAMLGNLFLNNSMNKFDIIVRKIEDIDQVIRLYNENYRDDAEKNLFVIFDDFLGRNKLDVGERALPDVGKLYSTSKHSNNLFICLNSRTQILQNAKSINSEFKRVIEKDFSDEKNFVIDLSEYSEIDKAHIFRAMFEKKVLEINDIQRKDLSRKYGELIGKEWKRIINHNNYSPRLIELLVENYEESDENFYNYIIDSLNHPTQIYHNLFENLEMEEKYLLFSILSFDRHPVKEHWIKESLSALDLNPSFNVAKSLQKLDGSWIVIHQDSFYAEAQINFLNPSIIDFLNDMVNKLPKMKLEIMKHSVYLHQLVKEYIDDSNRNVEENRKKFLERLLDDWETFKDSSDFIGEKLLAIIQLNKYIEYEAEFKRCLLDFKGSWNLKKHSNGWCEVISAIRLSTLSSMKMQFLVALENNNFVRSILDSPKMDSETIDHIAIDIDEIISDISSVKMIGYYAEKFDETTFYSSFREEKLKNIQDYLDDGSIIWDVNLDIDIHNFNLEEEVEYYEDFVANMAAEDSNRIYDWEINIFEELSLDFLRNNLYDGIQEEYNSLKYESIEDDDSEGVGNSAFGDIETVETILNKPLI